MPGGRSAIPLTAVALCRGRFLAGPAISAEELQSLQQRDDETLVVSLPTYDLRSGFPCVQTGCNSELSERTNELGIVSALRVVSRSYVRISCLSEVSVELHKLLECKPVVV